MNSMKNFSAAGKGKRPCRCRRSEAVFQYLADIVRLAHRVEMDGGRSVGNQVTALPDAPLCSDAVCLGSGSCLAGKSQFLENLSQL